MRLSLCLTFSFLSIFSLAQADCPPALPTLAEAQAYMSTSVPKNSGFLWRAEKDGRTSWLYGTVHYNQMEYAVLGLRVMQAARQSDVLALEIIPSQIQPLASAPDSATNSTPLTFMPTAAQAARLKVLVSKACMGSIADSTLFSAPVLMTLISLDNQRSKLSYGYSADARLAQFSNRSGKPMIALETPLIQFNALIDPASTKEQLSQNFDAFLTSLETGSLRRANEELVVMWQKSDIENLTQFETNLVQKDPTSAKRLNDDRNTAMAEKIIALHESGKRVFTAVGSVHMVGKNALPKLMEQAGFKVTYVPLNN